MVIHTKLAEAVCFSGKIFEPQNLDGLKHNITKITKRVQNPFPHPVAAQAAQQQSCSAYPEIAAACFAKIHGTSLVYLARTGIQG